MEPNRRQELSETLTELSNRELVDIAQGRPFDAWTPAAIEVAQELLDSRGVDVSGHQPARSWEETTLRPCPSCDSPMEPGEAQVRGTALGFLVAGLSHMHLWFQPRGGARRRTVLQSRARKEAAQCTVCGLLLLRT